MKAAILIISLFLFGCVTKRERERRNYDAMQTFNSRCDQAIRSVNLGEITEEDARDRAKVAFAVLRSTFAANGSDVGLTGPYPMTRCEGCGKFAFVHWRVAKFCELCMDDWSAEKYLFEARKAGAAW